MGLAFIVGFPALAAAWVAIRRGPQHAFLAVYLPVLLLLPAYYRWTLPGLPDPTFSEAAILPVAAIAIWHYRSRWRWSATDWLMLGFAGVIGVSQFVNTGYAEAQNLMFDMAAVVLLPYFCGKLLIEPFGLRVAAARRMVWMLFVLCMIGPYELKMGRTPFRILFDPFFPGQGSEWVTTFRYGLARVAGPYGHAILAGSILVVGYRLQRWLEWTGHWEKGFSGLPQVPKARLITLSIAAGILMTLVRGPWIGGLAGAALTGIGLFPDRKRAAGWLLLSIVAIGIPAGVAAYSWASVGRVNAKSASQETAAYRKELIDKYVDIALEHAWLGWGLSSWPRVSGMPSIDNYYLLLVLMHGVLAVSLLVAIFVWMMVRLYRHAVAVPVSLLPRGGSMGFTLLGILASIAVVIGTVFMGQQLMPIWALVTGWSEGFLLYTGDRPPASAAAAILIVPFRFARVVQ